MTLTLLLTLHASAAQLTITLDGGSKTWQTADLLKHPDAQTVPILNDVSYKRNITYRAVPLAALLPGIRPEDSLQAIALDGFVAELSAGPLLKRQGARAWLAVEDPDQPWPPLGVQKPRETLNKFPAALSKCETQTGGIHYETNDIRDDQRIRGAR